MEPVLTARQAYLVMFEFLRRHYERGPSDEVGGLLGGLALLADGGSADPALMSDFGGALEAVLAAEATPEGYRGADFAVAGGGPT